jgi:beta-galactosidase GanA
VLDNDVYNLMEQLVEESKSLWQIKNHYKEDACDCDECRRFWDKLEKDKEQHIEDLEKLLRSHM